MTDLNPYEEGLAVDLAKAQTRIEELEAERNEALNQLDSALYSISVLEKRAKTFCDGWEIADKGRIEAEAKLNDQTHLIEQFFALLDITEQTDEGRYFKPNRIYSHRVMDAEKLEKVLVELKRSITEYDKSKEQCGD